jgi:uncharacterized protein involved in exopolysaccharide biosynthesis
MAEQLPIRTHGFPVPYEDSAVPALVSHAGAGRFGDEADQSLDWRRYLGAVLRFKWLVLAITVVGTAGGVAATRFLPATYQAQATIWVPTGAGQGGGPIEQPQVFSSLGWIELIKTSFVVLDDVVRDLRLYLTPTSAADSLALSTLGLKQRFVPGRYEMEVASTGATFALRDAQGMIVQHGRVGDSIGPALGLAWLPASVY